MTTTNTPLATRRRVLSAFLRESALVGGAFGTDRAERELGLLSLLDGAWSRLSVSERSEATAHLTTRP